MNFNFSEEPEYDLNNSLVTEVINLYGVLTKFLITEKINHDSTVFGDYTHMKSNSEDIFEIYMLPEISEDWNEGDYSFNQGYFNNFDTINLFAARADFEDIIGTESDIEKIIGNLVTLPNNHLMEVTHVNITVPGVNNLFTYSDAKTVYTLSCKPYDNKLIQELDTVDISVQEDDTPYETLDTYFTELINQAAEIDTEVEVTESVETVIKTGGIDTKTNKPIVDTDEDDVWGTN